MKYSNENWKNNNEMKTFKIFFKIEKYPSNLDWKDFIQIKA